MRTVALDVQIVGWALRGEGNPSQPGLRALEARALLLYSRLAAEQAEVIVSSIVLAELFLPLSDAERDSLLLEINNQAVLVEFGLDMTREAARLFSMRNAVPASVQPSRVVLKYDTLIVAAAVVAGAEAVYAHDAGTREMALLAGLQAFDLPELPPN